MQFAPLDVNQKAALRKASTSSLPTLLSSLLNQNKSRVMDLFRCLDKNGDGEVSRRELEKALKELGVNASKQSIDDLFSHLDPDHSGGIEFRELQRALLAATHADNRRAPPAADPASKQQTSLLRSPPAAAVPQKINIETWADRRYSMGSHLGCGRLQPTTRARLSPSRR